MDINKLRDDIDKIDDEMLELFKKRMQIVTDVAEYKQASNKNVLDKKRENNILTRLIDKSDNDLTYYIKAFYTTIFSLSKSYQLSKMTKENTLSSQIKTSLEHTSNQFPNSAVVACQGVNGAYSQIAAEKLFLMPNITFFNSFEAVFHAVENGLCEFGVLPIENSSNGSVSQVYDLMRKRNFYITRSFRLKINHNLIAKSGTKLEDIKVIYSHEQALQQCREFIDKLGDVEVKICENTAIAAQTVAESEDTHIASISSKECADIYNLEIIKRNIQNTDNNYTRFICISKDMKIYPGSDKMSIMVNVSNTPGALFELMGKFTGAGLNLTKIESRPIAESDFEFMFYFDFEASIYSDAALHLMDELAQTVDQFKFLGSYIEK